MEGDGVLKDTLRKVNDFVDDDLLSCFLCTTTPPARRAAKARCTHPLPVPRLFLLIVQHGPL